MKITMDRSDFVAMLAAVLPAVKARPSLPILTNVRLTTGHVGADQTPAIFAVATDLDITIRAHAPLTALDVVEGGTILTDAKRLFDAAKALSGMNIAITLVGDRVHLASEGASFKLPVDDAAAYPNIPSMEVSASATFDAGAFAHQMGQAAVATSHDGSRPNLNGIFVHALGKGAKIVSTDGHRLIETRREWCEAQAAEIIGDTGFIIPNAGIGAIKRALDAARGAPATMGITGTQGAFLTVVCHHTAVSVRLLDAAFPDYRQVIPKQTLRTLTVMKALLVAALRRVQVVASERTAGVRLHIDGIKIRITVDNPDLGSSEETVHAIKADGDTKAMEIAFNAKYMLDALSVIDTDDVRFGLIEPLAPALVTPDGNDEVRCVLMPMRI